jgi:hypothetical protein
MAMLSALAVALTAQYAAPQSAAYVPQQIVYAAAPQAQPQAYELIQPGPLDRFLGHLGESLIRHSWPRLRPVRAYQAQPAIVYLVAQQQQIAPQASYVVQAQAPPQTYAAPPAYGTPQQGQYSAPRPSESVPPVPPR